MNSRNRNAKIKAMLAMALVLPTLAGLISPARARVLRDTRAEGQVVVDMTIDSPVSTSFLIPGGQNVRLDSWQVEQPTKVFQFPVQEGELEVIVEPENLVEASIVVADGIATVTLTHKVHLHSYTEEIIPPTCDAEGYTNHVCVCGDSYQDAETPVTGHSYTAEVTDPTCTEKGYTTHTCTVCGNSYKDTETEAVGHTYGEGVVTEPNCETKGYTTYTCTVCGYSENREETDALGHDYQLTATDAESGDKTYTCTRCQHTYTESQTPPETTDPTNPEETESTPVPDPTDPGTTDSETTDPGTTDSATTDPGTTDPGTTDSETTDSETTDPTTDSEETIPEPVILLTESTAVTIRIVCGETEATFYTELIPAVTQTAEDSGEDSDDGTENPPADDSEATAPAEGETVAPMAEEETVVDFVDSLGAVVQDHLYWLNLKPQEGVTYTLTISKDGSLLPNVRYSLDGGGTYTLMLEPSALSLPGETQWVLLDFSYTNLFEIPDASETDDPDSTDTTTAEQETTEPPTQETEGAASEEDTGAEENTEPETNRVSIIVEGSNGCATTLSPEVTFWTEPESVVLTKEQPVGIMDPTEGKYTVCVVHQLVQAEDGTIFWQEILEKVCLEEAYQDLFYVEYVDNNWMQLFVQPDQEPPAGSYRLTVYHQVGEKWILWDEVSFFIRYPMFGQYTGG